MHKPYHISEQRIAHYTVRRTEGGILIDGDLDKPCWKAAEKSARFVDLVTGEPAMLDTHAAALYDEENLYLAYWVREPQVTARFTERDSLIWFDNDVEFFLSGEDCYYELEINAFNTVYEVFFIYQDALKRPLPPRFDKPEFDLYARNVDVLSGFQDPARYNKHHRGKRWAFMDWDFPGLKTAVKVQGRINDPSSVDEGWTVEAALPWRGLSSFFDKRVVFPPQPGQTLRAQFFRFENVSVPGKDTNISLGWALNEHGVYDSHIPENFAYLEFA